ncbi:MAG: ABC transporter permease [Betaproteobacteria bacterium]|nr:ABC transporter permease [Betaproteobacteria bacterium]
MNDSPTAFSALSPGGSAHIGPLEKNAPFVVRLSGAWTLAGLPARARELRALEAELRRRAKDAKEWDLSAVQHLDSAGALLLWRVWGRRLPGALGVSEAQRHIFERVESLAAQAAPLPKPPRDPLAAVAFVGYLCLDVLRHLRDFVALIGQLLLDCLWLAAHPRQWPLKEFSATVYKSGALALPVTALVGCLIGVVISYLSSLQLRIFGADSFIVNILGISVIRELGPVLVAVLVAGRSGSAMTAQIGVMRVTEEIDALATMGISRSQRLVLPKVAALALTMPFLTLWCSSAALFGGMLAAYFQLGFSFDYFLHELPRAVPVANLWIGLGKGFVFGTLVALIACHFGLRVKPNTESLSACTTSSVVAAITTVILADAVFAIATRNIGLIKL